MKFFIAKQDLCFMVIAVERSKAQAQAKPTHTETSRGSASDNAHNQTKPNQTTTMKTIKIKSRHSSLASAVNAANMDLSYNAPLAARNIRDTDLNCRQAFVTEDDEVMFVFECDIPIIQKFSPFHSCLDNSPFSIAFIDKLTMSITDPLFQKTKEGRKSVSTMIRSMSIDHKIEAFAF